jgi:hypothetical protein
MECTKCSTEVWTIYYKGCDPKKSLMGVGSDVWGISFLEMILQILGADMVVGHPLYNMGWKAAPRPLIIYLYFWDPSGVPNDRTTSFDVVIIFSTQFFMIYFVLKIFHQ